MYKIVCLYNGEDAKIDSADTEKEAIRLVNEYRLAYGGGWLIWFELDEE